VNLAVWIIKNGASKLVASSPTPNSLLLLFKIRNNMKNLRISIMKAGQLSVKKTEIV